MKLNPLILKTIKFHTYSVYSFKTCHHSYILMKNIPIRRKIRVNALLLNYILFEKYNFTVDPFPIDFGIHTLAIFHISVTGNTKIILLASGKHYNFSIVVQSNCTCNIFLNKNVFKRKTSAAFRELRSQKNKIQPKPTHQ